MNSSSIMPLPPSCCWWQRGRVKELQCVFVFVCKHTANRYVCGLKYNAYGSVAHRSRGELTDITGREMKSLALLILNHRGIGSCYSSSSLYLDVITANSNADLSEVL